MYEVSIHIKATSDTAAIEGAEAAVQKLTASSKQMSEQVARASAPAVASLGVRSGEVRPLVGALATQMTGASGAAGALARGLTALIFTGLNPVGIAVAATTVAMGTGIAVLEKWTKEIDEQEKAIEKWTTALQAVAGLRHLADLETARGNPVKQITKELDRQKDLLEGAFPLEKQRIAAATEKLKQEKLITLEIQAQNRALAESKLSFDAEEVIGASVLGKGGALDAQLRVGVAGVMSTLNELTKYGARFGFIDPIKLQQAQDLVVGFGQIAKRVWGIEVPTDLEASRQAAKNLIDKLSEEYGVTLDTTDFDLAVGQAQAKIKSLRGEAERPIVFNVESGFWTQGSRRLPFSEYFQSYAPRVLKEFSEKASANLTMDTGLSTFLGPAFERLLRLEHMIARAGQPSLISGIHPGEAPGFDVERQRIMELIGWFMGLAARPQSGGAGGGGNINITIDASDLLNGLDRTVRLTTGHNLNVRVLN